MIKGKLLFTITAVMLLLLVVGAIIRKIAKKHGKNEGYPYKKVDSLFTTAERSFLAVLDDAVGEQFRIFAKVRFADIANIKNITNRQTRQRALNRITSKHLDYILCDKKNLSIVCAIELNDKSHQRQDRKERDLFIDNVCKTISLPLVKIQARSIYSVSEIRAMILKTLEKGE